MVDWKLQNAVKQENEEIVNRKSKLAHAKIFEPLRQELLRQSVSN